MSDAGWNVDLKPHTCLYLLWTWTQTNEMYVLPFLEAQGAISSGRGAALGHAVRSPYPAFML